MILIEQGLSFDQPLETISEEGMLKKLANSVNYWLKECVAIENLGKPMMQ